MGAIQSRAIPLVVLTLLLFTACGGGDPPSATSTPADQFAIVTPTPGTPPPRTPTPRAEQQRYTVAEGDSLSSIATRFGVSQEAIQRANDLDDPNSIYAGQELIIPAPEP